MHKIRAIITTTAMAGAVAACSSAPEPATRYLLVEASGDTLPQQLQEDERGCAHVLHGGEVVFTGDGQYRSSFDIRVTCPGNPAFPRNSVGTEGSVELLGDTVRFMFEEGETGRGRLTADSLVVWGAQRDLVYLRSLR